MAKSTIILLLCIKFTLISSTPYTPIEEPKDVDIGKAINIIIEEIKNNLKQYDTENINQIINTIEANKRDNRQDEKLRENINEEKNVLEIEKDGIDKIETAYRGSRRFQNDCPSDYSIHQLLPHETDCDKFYQCSNGNKFIMQCGPGTLFDVHLQVCNWPHAVNCQTSTTTKEPTTTEQTEPSTIEPTTTESTTNEPSTTELATIEHTEPSTTEPLTTESATNESFTTELTTIEPKATDLTTTEPTTTEHTEPSTTKPSTIEPTTVEPATVEPTTTEPSTAEPLTTESSTTEPTTVEPSTEPTTTEYTEPSTEPTAEEISTKEPTTTSQAPPICGVGVSGNVPHPVLCDSYYWCSPGLALQLYCSKGYEFDAASAKCVEIANGGCSLGNTTTESSIIEPSTTEPSTTEPSTTEITTVEPTTSPQAPPICAVGASGNVPHPVLCDSYYWCSPGLALQLHCSKGYEFDVVSAKCVEISEGGCTLGNTTTESSIIEPTTTESITVEPTATEPSNAEPTATESTTTERTEPTATEPSNAEPTASESTTTERTTAEPSTEPTTTEPSTVEPTTTSQAPPICGVGVSGNVPHPVLCDSYYWCSPGLALQLYCSKGYEFDAASAKCVEIAEGGCSLGNTTTESSIIEPSTTEPSTTEPSTTEITTVEPTTSPQAPPICAVGASGNVPHPVLCDSYYWCSPGLALQLHCSKGYEFDVVSAKCVEISEGGCFLGNTTTESSIIEPTTTESITVDPTATEPFNAEPTATESTTTKHTEPTATELSYAEPTASESTTTERTTVEPSTEPTTTEHSTVEPTLTSHAPPICGVGVSGNVPHPVLCDSYYWCSPGLALQLYCSKGYEFDAVSAKCVEISVGGCTLGNTSTTIEHTETTISATSVSTTTEPVSTEPITTEPTTKEPITAEPTTTEPTTTEPITAKPTTLRPIVPGSPIVPEPPVAPESTSVPELTAVTDATTVETETTTVETETVTVEIVTDSTDMSYSTAESSITTQQSTTAAPICPPGVAGNVPSPDRCDSYFMCSVGFGLELFCSGGYEYNADLQRCVMITEGGCTLRK